MSNRLPLKDRLKDHPMFAVVSDEEPRWCEWCLYSFEFCTCKEDIEEEEDDEPR